MSDQENSKLSLAISVGGFIPEALLSGCALLRGPLLQGILPRNSVLCWTLRTRTTVRHTPAHNYLSILQAQGMAMTAVVSFMCDLIVAKCLL